MSARDWPPRRPTAVDRLTWRQSGTVDWIYRDDLKKSVMILFVEGDAQLVVLAVGLQQNTRSVAQSNDAIRKAVIRN